MRKPAKIFSKVSSKGWDDLARRTAAKHAAAETMLLEWINTEDDTMLPLATKLYKTGVVNQTFIVGVLTRKYSINAEWWFTEATRQHRLHKDDAERTTKLAREAGGHSSFMELLLVAYRADGGLAFEPDRAAAGGVI
jgi:hypothetical protein